MRNVTLAFLILGAFCVRRFTQAPSGQPVMPAPAITESKSLPADFPTDVPLPAGAKCETSRKLRNVFSVGLTADQPVLPVVHFYQTALANQGWQVERISDADKEENQEGVSAVKNGRLIMVAVYPGVNNSTSTLELIVR